jgi:sugar phosphate isomerase/epimerase
MELGLTPDSRWDVDTPTLIGAAARAGFSAVGLFSGRVDAHTTDALRAAGLQCHELLGLVFTNDETATMSSALRLADDAGRAGAPWILTTFRCRLTAESAKLVRQCAAIFAEAGAGMAIEFSPLGPVATIGSGLDVLNLAGTDRAGLVIDSWNFFFGDSTWTDLEEVPLDRIAYLQFADALAPASDDLMAEALNRRALPGEGVMEVERFAVTLRDRGWDGLVSVQVLSSELRRLPLADFARVACDSARRYWL